MVSMLEKDWNIGNTEGGKERILSPNSQIIPLINNNTVDTFISIISVINNIIFNTANVAFLIQFF